MTWACAAAQRDRWAHTASLLSLLANCHRDPRTTRAFTPDDFMPKDHAAENRALPLVDITALKVFLKEPRT